jgi:beta-lactam-binding protein with PASTA domain
MSGFFAFFKSKQFFINLGIILAGIFFIFFLLVKWLASYTQHGDYVQVPDFKEVELSKLNDFVKDKSVGYDIIDSIYDPKQKAGVVIRQDPEAGTNVKHNRTVYLYVTGMVPPQIIMPKLINCSERQARLIISSYGLRLGKVSTRDAHCNGCVIAQMMHGKDLEAGQPVKKGSTVDLVIGVKDNFFTPMPEDTTKNAEPNFNNDPD